MKKLPIIILLTLLCLVSCKTEKVVTEYIEVPKVSIVEKHDTLRDSVNTIDSVLVYQRGDTVFLEKIRYKYRDRVIKKNSSTTDTITVVQEVPVVKEVEKKMSRWQKMEIYMGKTLMLLLAFAGVGGLAYLFIRKRL